MQIINEIINNYNLIIKLSTFTYFLIELAKKNRDHIKLQQKKQQIKKSQVLTLKQAFQQSKKDNSKFYLIKVIPDDQQSKSIKTFFTLNKQLYSNQYWCIEPSLEQISRQIINRINKAYKEEIISQKPKQSNVNISILNKLQWVTSFETKSWMKNKEKFNVNGFGTISTDRIFTVQAQYSINQKRGIMTKIHQNISYFFEKCVYRDIRKLARGGQKRRLFPTFKGPVIGQIKYFLKLITNQNILIHAKIQGNQIYPQFTALSKQQLLTMIQDNIYGINLQRIFIGLFLTLNYQWMKNDLARIRRPIMNKIKSIFKINENENKMKIFKADVDNLSQQKLCIICYASARNTLFYDCKHLILCNQCYQNMEQKKCPLCKMQINCKKQIYQYQA